MQPLHVQTTCPVHAALSHEKSIQAPYLGICSNLDCLCQVFERFLLGDTLEECYEAVAEVANRWLDMLDTQVVKFDMRQHVCDVHNPLDASCIVIDQCAFFNQQVLLHAHCTTTGSVDPNFSMGL